MREPIISDTTRTLYVVENPFGDEMCAAGFYVAEHCPVNGRTILPFPARATWDAAYADLKAHRGDCD